MDTQTLQVPQGSTREPDGEHVSTNVDASDLPVKPAVGYTAAGSSGVPDPFGARFSQPDSVTATVSSWRIPNSPGM
jgi:hypothetical protein